MSLFTRFLTEQRELTILWSGFLKTLDAGRTATLLDVLEHPDALKRLGLAHVIDHAQLRKRINAYCEYVNRIPGNARSLGRGCLIFFQSNRAGEDNKHRSKNPRYTNEPQQVRYFHTETEWTPETIGEWSAGTRLIRPGYAFTNDGWHGLYQARPVTSPKSGSVVGYRVPLYTELLGVDRVIATDYLARMIIHDMGHAHLPDVGVSCEPLHDVAMVHAMDARRSYPRTFQGLVHQECTDPFFFLNPRALWEIRTRNLSRPQRFLLYQLKVKYSAKALPAWAPLFNLTDAVTEEGARAHVTHELMDLRAGRYERYRKAA